MIKTRTVSLGDKEFKLTYSDRGMMVHKIGEPDNLLYTDAFDPVTAEHVYEETDTPIEEGEHEQ